MKLVIQAIGKRMPAWIEAGIRDYSTRFPRHIPLLLNEIAASERIPGSDIHRLVSQEGERLLKAAGNDRIIVLDTKGQSWDSGQLAVFMQQWIDENQDVSFLIGGPDGHSEKVLQRAHNRLSLSVMTLPHMLVRVVLAEQLYRAYSITRNHPYHRD